MLYLPLSVAVLLNLTSIGAFLYLMDYAARLLRPITILWRLGEQGLQVIDRSLPVPHQGNAHAFAAHAGARRAGARDPAPRQIGDHPGDQNSTR